MNMHEIARRAGVSSATVSRVINASPLVHPKTAERVQKILDEVNFIPNPSATTLKYGRSKTVGLVVPDISNPFYGEFLGAFEDLLIEADQEMLLTSAQSPEKLMKSIRRMLMRRVDGAVLMGSEFDTEAVEPLLMHKVPLITVDRRKQSKGCSDVAIQYEAGSTQAINLLKLLGHKRIGYIGGTEGLQTTLVRLKAFTDAIHASGLVHDPKLIRFGDYRVAGGETGIASLMMAERPPTAVLTANDMTAFGVIRGLHRLGLQVPRDVSVVGVDDLLLSEVVEPPLTTIRIPQARLARACIQALEYGKANIDGMGRQFDVDTELVVRESTCPPARTEPVVRSRRR